MATLKTVANNTAPPLSITCTRASVAINLTGTTVTVIIAKGSTITQVGRTATVTNAAAGIISYSPLTTDFPSAGTYKCDVKVVYSDASVEILYEQLKIKARSKIA